VASAIVAILNQQQTGLTVAQIVRQHGISEATFYNWNRAAGADDCKLARGFTWFLTAIEAVERVINAYNRSDGPHGLSSCIVELFNCLR
jgi:transposase-like protein